MIRLRHGDAKTLAVTLGEIGESLHGERGQDGRGSGKRGLLVRADESLNALVILADPEDVGLLEDIVRQLDVPRAQLLVEAAIVELSGEIGDALGCNGRCVAGMSPAALASPTAGCPSAPCWARCRPASRRQSCPTVR